MCNKSLSSSQMGPSIVRPMEDSKLIAAVRKQEKKPYPSEKVCYATVCFCNPTRKPHCELAPKMHVHYPLT